jgi:hypothetical protein
MVPMDENRLVLYRKRAGATVLLVIVNADRRIAFDRAG